MADNISSQYSNLFAGRLPANAAPPLPTANAAATVPLQPTDRMTLTSARPDMQIAVPTATATGDMRNDLLALQADLQRINKQIEAMLVRLDAQQQPGATPASNYPTLPAMPAPQAAPPTSYNVQAGDYLWKIAKDTLGDANRWPEIYELNKDAIGDNPNLVYPGLTLKLPGARPASNNGPANVPTNPAYPPIQPPSFPPPGNQPGLPPLNNPTFPPTNQPPAWPPPNQPPAFPPSNQPPAWPPTNQPPALPPMPPQIPTTPPQQFPTFPPQVPQQNVGVTDVPPVPSSNRQLSDQDVQRLSQDFGLAPPGLPIAQMRQNVIAFLDEMDSYERTHKGKVFGPGMEALAANPTEVQQIRGSVSQIQQALDLLIKSGRLRVNDATGRPVQSLPATGSFFKLGPNGQEQRGPNGAPLMDDAFINAITQFKEQQGIHQNYRLADGTWAINEYVGPATVEALKKALTELQRR